MHRLILIIYRFQYAVFHTCFIKIIFNISDRSFSGITFLERNSEYAVITACLLKKLCEIFCDILVKELCFYTPCHELYKLYCCIHCRLAYLKVHFHASCNFPIVSINAVAVFTHCHFLSVTDSVTFYILIPVVCSISGSSVISGVFSLSALIPSVISVVTDSVTFSDAVFSCSYFSSSSFTA